MWKKIAIGILVTNTVLFSLAATSSPVWYKDNPWKLTSAISHYPTIAADYYKHVVYKGTETSLDEYLFYWGIKARVFKQDISRTEVEMKGESLMLDNLNQKPWAICHLVYFNNGEDLPQVTCVATNTNGEPLDRNILNPAYRQTVYQKTTGL
jgi:hypothetical protein